MSQVTANCTPPRKVTILVTSTASGRTGSGTPTAKPIKNNGCTNPQPIPTIEVNHVTKPIAAAEAEKTPPDDAVHDPSPPAKYSRSVFYELTRRMTRLYSTPIDTNLATFNDDLRFVQRCLEQFADKPIMAQRVLELGFVELCQHVCRTTFFDPKSDIFVSAGDRLDALSLVLGVVADLADRVKAACERVLQVELHKDLFEILRANSLDPAVFKFDDWRCFVADCVMTVLYNVVQTVTESRELYRDENAVHVFQRFRANTSDSVSCMALILQSYVINDDENEVLGSDDRSFLFLSNELRSAVSNDVGRSINGYRASEILAAINKLAVNESNKRRIINCRALDSYVCLLCLERNIDEQFLATQGLWTLALSCPDDVRNVDGCVEGLKKLLKTTDVDGIRRQARGILDTLGIYDETSRPRLQLQIPDSTSASGQTPSSAATSGYSTPGSSLSQQIFISYNHGSKATVLRLRDRLKSAGFTVWVDEEGVYESIADDIITGLEQASVVLVCMTQKYYESPYCKKEVVYAAESYKKIIPLTLEPRYNPHGWLRFHASDGLRYDFSNEETFEDSFRKLVQVLRKVFESAAKEANNKPSGTQSAPVVSGHQEYLSAAATDKSSGTGSWTSNEVKKWLETNGLTHLHDWFKGFDGELLLEYKAYRQFAPETYAACVQDERQNGHLSIADVMRLNKALKRL